MIRINLLAVRPKSPERLDALLSPGGSSTFISRREGLLGVLFLVLTVVILGVLAYRFTGDEDVEGEPVASATEIAAPEPIAEPPAAESEPEPEAEPAAAALEPTPVQAEPEPAPVRQTAPPAPVELSPAPPARPTPASAAPASPEAVGSRALTGIRVTPLADRVDVFLEMADAPQVNSFKVDNPPRVVFDIPGARLQASDSVRDQTIDSPVLTRVRIAQNSFDPPLVRLVLEVPSFPTTETSTSSAGLSIRVTKAQ